MGRSRAARRRLPALAALVLVATPLTACGTESKAICGVIVDSTSYADPATSRNDVTSKLPSFAQECDWIGFAAVTGSSESSACRQDPVPIAATRAENPNENPVVEELVREHRITEVLPRAVQLFDCPGVVLLSPVEAAEIVIGHAELRSISLCSQ